MPKANIIIKVWLLIIFSFFQGSTPSTRCAYSSRIPPLATQTTTTPGGAIMYQKQVSSGSGGGFHQFETGFHFDMGTSHTHRSERTSTKSASDTRTSFSTGGSYNFSSSANSSSSSRVSSYSDDYRGMDWQRLTKSTYFIFIINHSLPFLSLFS